MSGARDDKALEALAAQLLDAAKAAGADEADVLVASGVSVSVSARDGALEEVERSEGLDFGVRVLVGGRSGGGAARQASVSASDPDPDILRALAERAVAMAREAPEDPDAALAPAALRVADPDAAAAALGLADAADEPSADSLLDAALALEAAALAVAGVSKAESAGAGWSRGRRLLATSDGFLGAYESSSRSIGVSAIAGDGLGMERDYAFSTARGGAGLKSASDIGREAGERAVARLNPKKAKKGVFPVLFEPRVAAGFIGSLIGAMNGEAVARGSSFLAKKMGARILPEGVDIHDDPTRPSGLGSRPFDGEGVTARPKRLVADGVLSAWLLDTASARRLRLETNGSAARGVAGTPSPSASNAWITAGADTPEALMAEIDEGLLVTEMMGRGVNPVTGDYSRGASGFWIENGKIAYPVSELTVASHVLEMAATLKRANDLAFERRIDAPTLRFEGLTLGSG